MTIQEAYQKLIARLHLPENQERYTHLVISPNKTEEEECLNKNILTLGEYIRQIETYSEENREKKALLESGCKILLPKIEAQLNKNNWK